MIVVVADDFTGAAELASAAVFRGLKAQVQTVFVPDPTLDVIALDTNTRICDSDMAVSLLRAVMEQVVQANPDWIFKKTDSVFRGNPRSEILEMLRSTHKTKCIFIPANPSRGRTIVQGIYTIDGVPLHRTPFGHDPTHPIGTSYVPDIFGETASILIPDIGSLEDIPRHLGAELPAGGVDFFSALLGHAQPMRPDTLETDEVDEVQLAICGSLDAWRRNRASEFQKLGFSVFTLDDPIENYTWKRGSKIMLAIGEAKSIPQRDKLPRLIQRAKSLLADRPPCHIAIEGGETARAFVDAMGWTRLDAVSGLNLGGATLRTRIGTLLSVKPGSYPWIIP
jgi:D-threonate/D-erythronate kinase